MTHKHNKLVRFAQLLTRSQERITIEPDKAYQQITVRLWGKGVVERGVIQGSQIAAPSQFVARPGQFIISRIDARNGAVGLVPATLDGAVVTNDFPIFFVNTEEILPEFLAWMSKTQSFVDLCIAASEGTTNRVRLQEERFLATEISLPPLDEQPRIVARIEALAGRVAEAQRLRAEAILTRKTIVKHCVEDIFNQNHRRWPQIPLGELLREDTLNGLAPRLSDNETGIPVLRISAGTSRVDAVVNESDYKYLDVDDMTIEKYRLLPGDLLACRFNGNLHYVGKFSIYRNYSNTLLLYPDKLIRFRVDDTKVLPEFARIALNSPQSRREIEAMCATTAGNIGISGSKLKTITLPVPPLAEQQNVITRINALQTKDEELHCYQSATQTEIDALLPAILDKAFRGEL